MIFVATITGWPSHPWILKAESTVCAVTFVQNDLMRMFVLNRASFSGPDLQNDVIYYG